MNRRTGVVRHCIARLTAGCAGLALVLASGMGHADGDDDTELLALLDLLHEQTMIATKTRMNADYVPGMVTVLHGEDMRIRGLATVRDALGQVAGFHVTVNNVGDARAIVRGVGATLNASNLKILLDGVAVNRATDGSADWVLRLPLSQIERIEVIRGPGSALYGGFAFSGVVNVLTRGGDAVDGGIGSEGLRRGGLRLSLGPDGVARLKLGAGAWRRSDSGLRTNPDNFSRAGLGYSPAPVFDGEHGRYLLATLDARGYRLHMRHAVLQRGGAYGRVAALPEGLEPRLERVLGLDLDKEWALDDTLTLSASVGMLQTDLEQATLMPLPAGAGPPGLQAPSGTEFYRRTGSADRAYSGQLALRWAAGERHRIYFGVDRVHSKVTDSFASLTARGGETRILPPDQAPVLDGSSRTLTSLTVQDQIRLGRSVELTAGLRHDHYDDWGGQTSPRLAAVWQPAEHHIVKMQYAEAFRPPNLEEFYPGPNTFPGVTLTGDLDKERIRSLEAAYIFRRADLRMRLTVYRTQVRDLIEFFINPGDPPLWRNRGDIEAHGMEFEWVQRFGRSLQWWANLAYVEADDHLDDDERLLGAVDWLATLGASWRQNGRLTHAVSVKYVGEPEGWELPTRVAQRQRFDDYATLDYALTLAEPYDVGGLQISAGVRNLTDQHFDSVATPAQFPEGLPHGQREFWLSAEYRFR
ncbi:MAG: TonB-dependent receptor [Rhodocyclaceae bacterium]|nr:TonB-dependent receptor [Rhodocyclaceae bacterium]